MALSRAVKQDLVQKYGDGMASAPHVFVMGVSGITVAEVDDLRRRVREQGGQYLVVKNRLAKIAVEGGALAEIGSVFEGPTSVAYSETDAVALAKALTEFAKEVPKVEFKGGVLDGQAIEASQVQAIASLPSREELIAKLLFLLQSPTTRFVRGLAAIPQQFVSVLHQIGQAKEA